MSRITLHRRVRFEATHQYGHPNRSEAENRLAFGALVDPHSHTFVLEVEVSGSPHPETGFVLELPWLDGILQDEVLNPLHGSHLNDRIPLLAAPGATHQPCTEVLVRWIADRLRARMGPPLHLRRVTLWESDELGASVEYEG